MADLLKAEHFLPHVDKIFRVKAGHLALTLVRVERPRREDLQPVIGERDAFNLIFRGPPGNLLREGLYTLDVDGGLSFDLYIIPIHTPARDRQDYQAAFN